MNTAQPSGQPAYPTQPMPYDTGQFPAYQTGQFPAYGQQVPTQAPFGPPPGYGTPQGYRTAPGYGMPSAPAATGNTGLKLVAAVVAAAALLGGGAYALLSSPSNPEARTVQLSSAGADPFTPPVGKDDPTIVPVTNAGERSGDTAGLFAQNPAQPSCDGAALVSALQTDPARSGAWAGVLGITPDLIPGFVNSLTPVVLRADTAVIDHGFTDGTFTSTPAVLPAGSAVFINSYGEPTVRCYSGNPLTRPVEPVVTTRTVTVVRPAPRVIERNVFVNQSQGNTKVIVIGKDDPKPDPGPNPERDPKDDPKPDPKPDPGPNPKDDPKPDPAPLPPGARYTFEGDILVPDGQSFKLLDSDGKPKGGGAFSLAEGVTITKNNPDGSFTTSDGNVLNANGSTRKAVKVTGPNGQGVTVNPDGTTDPKVDPAPRFDFDGKVIVSHAEGGYELYDADGNKKDDVTFGGKAGGPTVTKKNPDGSFTMSDGSVRNGNGSTRKPVKVDGIGTLNPDGVVDNENGTKSGPPQGFAAGGHHALKHNAAADSLTESKGDAPGGDGVQTLAAEKTDPATTVTKDTTDGKAPVATTARSSASRPPASRPQPAARPARSTSRAARLRSQRPVPSSAWWHPASLPPAAR